MEEFDQYIPPLWVMCLESVAHLLVMLNFSTNFIIYCSVSAPFKKALSKVTGKIFRKICGMNCHDNQIPDFIPVDNGS